MNMYSDYDDKNELSEDSVLQDSRLMELDPGALQEHRIVLDSEGHPLEADGHRLIEVPRSLQDPRLLDAAETLASLRGTDLGPSNNPLFGGVSTGSVSSSLTVLQNSDPFSRDDKSQYQLITEMTTIPPNLIQLDSSANSGINQEDGSPGGGGHQVLLASASPGGVIVSNTEAGTLNTQQTPGGGPTRGRGRGRGATKRGRGKKDPVGGGAGVGRGGVSVDPALGVGGGGGGGAVGDGGEGEEGDVGGEQSAEKPTEMLRVGSLFIKSSIFDDILTERKLELFNNPAVIEFLNKNRICS